MDHPEHITERPVEMSQCRRELSVKGSRAFVDQATEAFHSLEDVFDWRCVYENGKQLGRAYFD